MIQRRTPLHKSRITIRRITGKRLEQVEKYDRIKPAWLRDHPTCEIGPIIKAAGYKVTCRRTTTHVHHVAGRIGKKLLDQSDWLASCDGECHPSWIHDQHPSWARELGLLK